MADSSKRNKIIPIHQRYDIKQESEKNTFGKRLREARQKKGWSLRTVAEKLADYNIHIQSPAVNRWELGMSVPNAYQLFALCRLLDIEDGIRYFSGPLHSGETALNEEGLKRLETYRKDLIASGNYNNVDFSDNSIEEIEYRVGDLAASAGLGNFLDDESYHMESFQKNTVPEKADFALKISGDSMMPNYTDGQLVWVQETSELYRGEIGIFILNGCGYMKMYTEIEPDKNEMTDYQPSDGELRPKIALVSLNKKYAPIIIGEYDDFRVVGRVLTK